jgi:hypothetical protein
MWLDKSKHPNNLLVRIKKYITIERINWLLAGWCLGILSAILVLNVSS